MPDIAMCKNITCPLKTSCYRYTAKPNSWQSYGNFTYDTKNLTCESYWHNQNI